MYKISTCQISVEWNFVAMKFSKIFWGEGKIGA